MGDTQSQDEPHPRRLPQDQPPSGEQPPSNMSPHGGKSRPAWLAWLTGGSVAIILLGGVGIAVAVGIDDPHHAAAPSRTHAAAPSRTFTHAPLGCDMVKPATIAPYVPTAKCTSGSEFEKVVIPGDIKRIVDWEARDKPIEITARLNDLPNASQIYNLDHWYALANGKTEAHQVSGLGDAAYIIYHNRISTSHCELLSYWGNAELEIKFDGNRTNSRGYAAGPVDQQTAEAAVLAVARDIYASLS